MKNQARPHEELAGEIEKKYHRQDHRKSKTMKVSGKSVFKLKRIKDRKSGS